MSVRVGATVIPPFWRDLPPIYFSVLAKISQASQRFLNSASRHSKRHYEKEYWYGGDTVLSTLWRDPTLAASLLHLVERSPANLLLCSQNDFSSFTKISQFCFAAFEKTLREEVLVWGTLSSLIYFRMFNHWKTKWSDD